MGKRNRATVWQARMRRPASERHVAYCAGWDVRERPMADAVLVPYDLWVNRAHALMLHEAGIITRGVHRKLQRALSAVEREWRAGRWTLVPALEDVHVNVERAVTEHAGEAAGGWLHTARSRNDQTATDVRLFVRDATLAFQGELLDLVAGLTAAAHVHLESLMPGLSHTQPSCVTTLGHLLCAHAQGLVRDAEQMRATYGILNVCPLGAAAGYGTSWRIDRKAVARHLGFDGVQENSIDCVSSRWEMEARLVADLALAGNHLALLAQDLVLLSHPWAGFVAFDDRHVTGSSIMPQKRNPDFAEVTRAKTAVVHGVLQSLLALNKGMVSGYNRDSQWSKYLVLEAAEELRDTPAVLCEVVESMRVDTARMAEAASRDFLVAVDLADLIARRGGLPFRAAYDLVARLVRDCETEGRFTAEKVEGMLAAHGLAETIKRAQWEAAIDPARAVRAKRSLGGPAPAAVRANLKRVEAAATDLRRWNAARCAAVDRARDALVQAIGKSR